MPAAEPQFDPVAAPRVEPAKPAKRGAVFAALAATTPATAHHS
ncbi:MAG: hypothetical protein ACKVG5_07215 [Acidimicrobiales bacterium]